MDENQSMEQQTQNTGENVTAQETETRGKKLFTQDEVNGFLQARLSRMKSQASKEAQVELEQKMADLTAREMKLMVREKLQDRGMPRELADVISCADEKEIETKLDALQRIYGGGTAAKEKEQPAGFTQVGTGGGQSGFVTTTDPVRKAMGLG